MYALLFRIVIFGQACNHSSIYVVMLHVGIKFDVFTALYFYNIYVVWISQLDFLEIVCL